MSTANKLSDSSLSTRHDRKWANLLKVGSVTLYIIFGTITLVQLFFLIKEELTTTKLYTEMRRMPTMNMEPSLIASICVKPSHSQAELEKAGYTDYMMFYNGMGSKFFANAPNISILSWSGDGNFEDPSKLLEQVLLWKKLSDFVASLIILKDGQWRVVEKKTEIDDLVEEGNHYVSGYCFTMKSEFMLKTSSVEITFVNNASLEVEILLKDAGIFTKRTILEHSTNYKGAKAGTKFEAQDNKVKDFIVEVSQEVFAEEDVTKNCSLYPNKRHSSYGQCDTEYTRAVLADTFGPDFRPLWIENNLTRVTGLTYPGPLDYTPYFNLILGIQLSDCKLPCTTTRTYTQEVGEYMRANPGIKVNFVKDMQVEFDLMTFECIDPNIAGD